ncbi:MAG: MerR family transcriptional regulator [Sphingobacteriales bacterium]|nr:MAG: MerR family transcriptional regulator [Sphingobacteriales bacterium]
MLIGALSKASGFSKDTIRYYEKIGLIELPKHARRDNNYKDYPESALQTLKSIRNLKNLGFTLEEIREILIRTEMQALDNSKVLQIIEQKIIHLDMQVDKLLLYKHRLQQAQMLAQGEKVNKVIPLTEISMEAA